MKTIFNLLVAILLLSCSSSASHAQEPMKKRIGSIENGKVILDVNEAELVKTYSENLKKLSRIDGRFTSVKMVSGSEQEHFFVFEGPEYKSTFGVVITGQDVYALPGISCTTSDCSSEQFGCTPHTNGAACRSCSNNGACTKTVSNSPMF